MQWTEQFFLATFHSLHYQYGWQLDSHPGHHSSANCIALHEHMTRDAPITHWPIIGRPIISAKQSADYRLIQKFQKQDKSPQFTLYNSTLTMDTCGVVRGVAWGGVARRGRSLTSHHPCRAPLPTPVMPPLSRRDRWSPLDTTASNSSAKRPIIGQYRLSADYQCIPSA